MNATTRKASTARSRVEADSAPKETIACHTPAGLTTTASTMIFTSARERLMMSETAGGESVTLDPNSDQQITQSISIGEHLAQFLIKSN